MHRSHLLRTTAVVAVLALAIAACEVDDNDEPVVDDPTEDVEEEPDEEPAEPEEDVEAVEGDGTLNLGSILAESGPLAFLGPPQIQAVELAVDDMNAAGGVLGTDVTLSGADEAGDTTIAAESAQRLIGEGVNAIVGAAASGMSLAFVDAVTSAGVLQGPVLAEAILGDGTTNPAIIARADDDGQGLLQATVEELEAQGATVAAEITYDPEAASFDAEVNQVAGSGADSVAIIAFEEASQILATVIDAGSSPQDFPTYGADGMRSNELASLVDPGDASVLDGMRGTGPSPEASPDFLDRFLEETGLDDATFAAQAYDCAIIIGLAAELAGSDVGEDIAAQMVAVTDDGTECEDFAACLGLIQDGEDIAYQTASGVVLTLTDAGNGEPRSGEYEIWEIDDTGTVSTVTTVPSAF